MPTATEYPTTLPTDWSLAELQEHLGGVSSSRIRLFPPPGLATVADVIRNDPTNRHCELIDGVLVEKDMGYYESIVAVVIARLLGSFVDEHDLGVVGGEGGTLQVLPNQVRMPDVWFVGWDKFPDRKLPREPVPLLAPDLAIEILSAGNTRQEMSRKLRDYFEAGVSLVWYIDAQTQTARTFAGLADDELIIEAGGTLSAGNVVPGFELSLAEVFERAGSRE